MKFSRPGGTHAGGDDDPALKRRAIIGLSRWDEENAAAGVSPLIIPAGEKFEPTHVGCYGFPNSAGATGRADSAHDAWR
ncbi:MAG: hypothetical protein WBN75_10970 [Verrucomicrobiia bacterium]